MPILPFEVARAKALTAFKRVYLQELLAATDGNQGEAAHLGKLHRVSLSRMLHELGMQPSQVAARRARKK